MFCNHANTFSASYQYHKQEMLCQLCGVTFKKGERLITFTLDFSKMMPEDSVAAQHMKDPNCVISPMAAFTLLRDHSFFILGAIRIVEFLDQHTLLCPVPGG